jgi:hypothetical protein
MSSADVGSKGAKKTRSLEVRGSAGGSSGEPLDERAIQRGRWLRTAVHTTQMSLDDDDGWLLFDDFIRGVLLAS